MNTLSYGYSQPVNPDTGDIFYPALTANWQQVNDHNHDGANSAPLASQTANILAANWTASSGLSGIYEQTITMPAGLSYDTADIWFLLSSGERVYPSQTKVSSTQYKVFTSDSGATYKALYR